MTAEAVVKLMERGEVLAGTDIFISAMKQERSSWIFYIGEGRPRDIQEKGQGT